MERILTTGSYGICVFSLDVLHEFIKDAKKINDWETIGSIENLQELFIHNCGFIKNLNFLMELHHLKRIKNSSTKVEENFDWIWNFEPFKNTAIHMPNGVYRNP